MRETPPNAVAIAEPNPRERLLGLIGAMKDGMVTSFEHDGVQVHRFANSIAISPEGPPQDTKGGRHLLDGADLNDLAEWIETKADHYGE